MQSLYAFCRGIAKQFGRHNESCSLTCVVAPTFRFVYFARMPRYYFCLDADDDDDGIELANDDAAREAARDLFGQSIRDGDIKEGGTLLVRDATGRRVAKLAFSAEQ